MLNSALKTVFSVTTKPFVVIKLALFIAASFCNLSGFAEEATLRDPTRPLNFVVTSQAKVKLQLQALIGTADSRRAVINGTPLAIGQKISGYSLVSITNDSVTVKNGSDVRTLQLRPKLITINK